MNKHRSLMLIIAIMILVILGTAAALWISRPRSARPDEPNILIILTDDQRYDTMEFMPRTQERLLAQGLTFSNAYVTTPNCCPSRSSILTGLYAHHHEVLRNSGNSSKLTRPTFVQTLHDNGYYTGIVGKYLNSYPVGEEDGPLPEFDSWVAHGSLGSGGDYFDYFLNVQGTWEHHTEYMTYALRDYALDFVNQAARKNQPFFLLFAVHAPHLPARTPEEDRKLYPDLPDYRPQNFNEEDVSDKPHWIQEAAPLTDEEITRFDNERRRQLQSLHAVDESVDAILTRLDRRGLLENTVVIYLSDNGEMWGEHRLRGKPAPYEPAIRIPFGIWYPKLITAPRVEDRLVANIDIAPTILELAGITPATPMDGRSLVPMMTDSADEWRDTLIIEGWGLVLTSGYFSGLHTERYVYMEVFEKDSPGEIELYDLETDPFQLDNLAGDPAYAELQAELKARYNTMMAGP
jgi:N-acetylglucosamine-6-sulfatase